MEKSKIVKLVAVSALMASSAFSLNATAEDSAMSFFLTSVGPGDGANLGGLEGADAHCSALASAAGSKIANWKAYLSLPAKIDRSGDKPTVIPGVNARDRIGSGPWHNAKSVLIASSVDELHSPKNPMSKAAGLDENGNEVNSRVDKPNRHDILTGSDPQGMYAKTGIWCHGIQPMAL